MGTRPRWARRMLSRGVRALRGLARWTRPGTGLTLERGRLPIVRVSRDGDATLSFLIDTAAGLSVFDSSVVARLGLESVEVKQPDGALPVFRDSEGRGLAVAGAARIRVLLLGPARPLEIEACHLDLSGPFAALGRPDLAGIFGQDLLRRFAVLFDVRRGEVRLLDSRRLASDLGRLYGARQWMEQAVDYEDDVPVMRVPVEGRGDYRMLIDTGCTHVELSGRLVRNLGLEVSGRVESVGLHGVMRESDAYEHADLAIGGWWIAPGSAPVHQEDLGILGYDALRRSPFVLDGPRSRLLAG